MRWLLAVVVAVSGCNPIGDIILAQGVKAQQEIKPKLSIATKASFIANCIKGGGSSDQCACAVNEFEKRVTPEEVALFDANVALGNKPDAKVLAAITMSVDACH